ncbi:hypothetical protein [Sphingomonas sp.]|uniref:hypothetical protein n=1 Tax=Sphingomonas sp. TaxID=28214 RepID=UPI00286E8991|nr:hypothetical protein [Sphingomonas sp.]
MWKFLLGPILLGIVCLVGSIYGANAQQIVRKPPGVVRAALGEALAGAGERSVTLEGGKSLAYAVNSERVSDDAWRVRLMLNGEQGAETLLNFAPADGGAATLITAKVDTDGKVLRAALAGTDKAKLGYAPDWVFNLTLRPVLRQLAAQIEHGDAVSDPMQGGSSAQAAWEAEQSPERQREVQAWRQPMTI